MRDPQVARDQKSIANFFSVFTVCVPIKVSVDGFIVLLPLKKTTTVWLKHLVKKGKFFVEPSG